MECFAIRLVKKYFPKDELPSEENPDPHELFLNLDPIRIDFIKSHLDYINGGEISPEKWITCKNRMASSIGDSIKREYVSENYNSIEPKKII